jgi:hypothetical protein
VGIRLERRLLAAGNALAVTGSQDHMHDHRSRVPLITTSVHMHIKHRELELPGSRNLYFAAQIMMQPSNK